MPACLERLNQAYERLGIKFDVTLGESFYHDHLAGVVEDLLRRGIARESEGAICVFPESAAGSEKGATGSASPEPPQDTGAKARTGVASGTQLGAMQAPPMIVRKKDGAFLYS